MGAGAKPRPHTHLVYLEDARKSQLAATFFFHKRPKKKQLYRQEVPERRSEQQKHQHKFPVGGIPPGYKCGRNTALQRRLNALYRRELRSDVFWLCVAYRPNLVLVCMKKADLALLFRIHRSLY